MGKKDLTTIDLTQTQAEKYTAEQIQADLIPRLSNRRCKAYLVQKIETGIVKVPANSIGTFTYKAIAVEGTDVGDVPGKKDPIKTFKKAEYNKLEALGIAALVKDHTTEKRATYVVQALLESGKLSPTPADLVYLSNGRITVEGIVIESTRKGLDMGALIAGVEISQPDAEDAAA